MQQRRSQQRRSCGPDRRTFLAAVCGWPLLFLAASAAADDAWKILEGESEIRVLAFRTGTLARLGHNHVVTTSDVSGTIVLGDTAAASRFEFSIPVESFVVDDPEARAEEGEVFAGSMSADQREDTRRNMLGAELLDAAAHPGIRVASRRIAGEFPEVVIVAAITVKGVEREVELPAFVTLQDGRLTASGTAELSHEALGLSPFSAAFGAVRVADLLRFRYRLVAIAPEQRVP